MRGLDGRSRERREQQGEAGDSGKRSDCDWGLSGRAWHKGSPPKCILMPDGTPFGWAGCLPASQQFGPGEMSPWSCLQTPTGSHCGSKALPQIRPGHSTQMQDGRCGNILGVVDTITSGLPAGLWLRGLQMLYTNKLTDSCRFSEAHAERRSEEKRDASSHRRTSLQLGGRNLSRLRGRARGRCSTAKATALPGGREDGHRQDTHPRPLTGLRGEAERCAFGRRPSDLCFFFLSLEL